MQSIQTAANNIIIDYFKQFKLTQTIDISSIVNQILNLNGVATLITRRTDRNLFVDGLNLLVWNPIYPEEDVTSTGSNVPMPYYKYPYLHDPMNFIDKIEVVTETGATGSVRV